MLTANNLLLSWRTFKKFARENTGFFLVLKFSGLLPLFAFPEKSPLLSAPNCEFIYLRLHRVGGTSTAMALGVDKIHCSAKEAINCVGRPVWDSTYKFAFVRNPFAKAVSTYNHFPKNDRFQMKSNPITFDDWISRIYGPKKDAKYYFSASFFQSQSDWLKDHQGVISLDKIAKLENIEEDFADILEKLGLQAPIPHVNGSKIVDYRTYYTEKSYELVRNWHQEDLNNFGYTFDNG